MFCGSVPLLEAFLTADSVYLKRTIANLTFAPEQWLQHVFHCGTGERAAEVFLAHIVIIGGGFGGLACARSLAGADVIVTLVDRRNHHLFQPLLYEVATAALSPADIAVLIRQVLAKVKNTHVVMGEVADVDPSGRRVILTNGANLEYDQLVVATGSA